MFRLITKHKSKEHKFDRDPMKPLVKDCHNEARKAIETKNSQSEERNMKKFGKCCIIKNGMIDMPVR